MAMLVMPLELFRERDDHNDMSLQRKNHGVCVHSPFSMAIVRLRQQTRTKKTQRNYETIPYS